MNKEFDFENLEMTASSVNDEIVIQATQDKLLELISELKTDKQTSASCLIGIFGVHYPNEEKEFMIEYLLLSIEKNVRYRIQLKLSQNQKAQSIENIFAGSIWYEREVFDMFGIEFENLSDHRRILTDYEFKHHPLRKEFPVTGFDEVKYNPISSEVEYSPLELTQEYRKFDNTMDIDQSTVFAKINQQK